MSIFDKAKPIKITDIEDVRIGNAQDNEGGTGCTVIITEKGAVTGVDIRGGGPATRETDRLSPLCPLDQNHALILSGGSAFGLDASAGVMQFLEEKEIGYKTRAGLVPLVSSACIYDLVVGSNMVRPDKQMGYNACVNAYKGIFNEGNYGAGTGATVGKIKGPERMMKSGLGTCAYKYGDLEIAALVVVNAFGDVYDMATGSLLAGLLNEDRTEIIGTESVAADKLETKIDYLAENTTIGCIITNAVLTNSEASKISGIAHNGLARVIWPVHTSADGDAVFTMGTGKVKSDTNMLGAVASEIMAIAINNAVRNADPAYGLETANDFI